MSWLYNFVKNDQQHHKTLCKVLLIKICRKKHGWNILSSWRMINTSQNFVESSFSTKLTKISKKAQKKQRWNFVLRFSLIKNTSIKKPSYIILFFFAFTFFNFSNAFYFLLVSFSTRYIFIDDMDIFTKF